MDAAHYPPQEPQNPRASFEPISAKNPKMSSSRLSAAAQDALCRKRGTLWPSGALLSVSIHRCQGESEHPLRHRQGGHGPIPEVQGQTTTASDTNTVSKFGPKQSSVKGVSVTQASLPQMKNNKGAWLRQKLMTEENHFF